LEIERFPERERAGFIWALSTVTLFSSPKSERIGTTDWVVVVAVDDDELVELVVVTVVVVVVVALVTETVKDAEACAPAESVIVS
jgi:hypothetical protein